MSKQTFTTGQVLTAAQMTSLQQTAMGGGSTTAKTTSYVLVAADAGTVVQMNAAGATTITVNTGLFAAGDSVQIQNIGAGVCTVTAGTATVSTAGSLALSQYEGGQLYFNTTSAALFFDIVQSSGMTNPMTTTGDTIYSSSGTTPARLGIGSANQALGVSGGIPAWQASSKSTLTTTGDTIYASAANTLSRLGIGSTGQVLTVASGIPSWATPAGGSMTSLATGTFSGATTSISSISGSYKHLVLWVTDQYGSGANKIYMQFNTDTGSNYTGQKINGNATPTVESQSGTLIATGNGILTTSNGDGYMLLVLPFYSTTASAKHFDWWWDRQGSSNANEYIYGTWNGTAAITSIEFKLESASTFSGGAYTLYGVN